VGKTLLIIRLDDIGDYLLFRNQLPMYKKSERWRKYSITLLGNSSWKEIFTRFDADCVDDIIWVNKGEYLSSAPYRSRIWAQLRGRGFETVIAPSRTRPLLLDDLCRLAAAPLLAIGSTNTYIHPSWNQLSDGLYQHLFTRSDVNSHEFHFNGQFSAWVCGGRFDGSRPSIDCGADESSGSVSSDIICFIGSNTRSRRWPARRWIEFINLYRRRYSGKVILAGSSRAELELAVAILAKTDAESIVGKVSILDLVRRVGEARAVLSNDTMAAHLSVSMGRPTVIIANGVNYQRFTDYAEAGIEGVATLYPEVFLRKRRRTAELSYNYPDALTADIASISAAEVLAKLEETLSRAGY